MVYQGLEEMYGWKGLRINDDLPAITKAALVPLAGRTRKCVVVGDTVARAKGDISSCKHV